jgi:hypothetical protein
VEAPDLIALFVRPLEELEIPYMVTGGVAAVVYGDPRFTRDIDIVLRLDAVEAARLASGFDEAHYYVPPLETLRREAGRRRHGHFNLIHKESGLRADVYLLDDGALHQWGFGGRRTIQLATTPLSVAPPEYVIVRKLQYYRESGSDRHLRDIAMMLRISEGSVDLDEIGEWVARLGLQREWEAAMAYAPG